MVSEADFMWLKDQEIRENYSKYLKTTKGGKVMKKDLDIIKADIEELRNDIDYLRRMADVNYHMVEKIILLFQKSGRTPAEEYQKISNDTEIFLNEIEHELKDVQPKKVVWDGRERRNTVRTFWDSFHRGGSNAE